MIVKIKLDVLVAEGRQRHDEAMNIISLLIGFVTLALGLVAFLPLLGWMNWFVIPIGIVGAAVGALSSGKSGRNLNLVLIVIFTLRLMLGGGIF